MQGLFQMYQECHLDRTIVPWHSAICSRCAINTRMSSCGIMSPTCYYPHIPYLSLAWPLEYTITMTCTLVSCIHHLSVVIKPSPLLSTSVVKSIYWVHFLIGSVVYIQDCVIIFCTIKMYTSSVLQRGQNGDRFRSFASRSSFTVPRPKVEPYPTRWEVKVYGIQEPSSLQLSHLPIVLWQNYWTHLICLFTFH
jgi:hypothetical protein